MSKLYHELINRRDTGNSETNYYAYQVRKIGTRCWMVQNLALPGGTTYAGTYSNFPSEESTFTLPVSDTTWGYSNTEKYVFNGWHIGQGDGDGNILTHAEADSYTTDSEGNANGGNTGAYYSYPAAAAINTKIGTTDEDNNKTKLNEKTLYSICPRNWRLPSSVDNVEATVPGGDFGALTDGKLTAFNTSVDSSTSFKLFQSALPSYCDGFGCITSSKLGTFSYWWSSTVYSETKARFLLATCARFLTMALPYITPLATPACPSAAWWEVVGGSVAPP